MNIIKLVKEAGFEVWEADYALQGQLERFAALVRAESLEEAAKMAEAYVARSIGIEIAAAIRGLK